MYRRFFTLLRQTGCAGDLEEVRRAMVMDFSRGRTDSLRELSRLEYTELCNRIERTLPPRQRIEKAHTERKKWETAVYGVLKSIGVNVRDAHAVRSFLSARTIGCKNLGALDEVQMRALFVQLKEIERKQGSARLNKAEPPRELELAQ